MKKMINFLIIALVVSFTATYAEGNLVDVTTNTDFTEKVLNSTKPVFVKFSAKWCSACQNMQPIIDDIAGAYKDKYDFITVDVDAGKIVADRYRIRSLPTIMFFNENKQLAKITGEQTKEKLVDLMTQLFER